jgi:feruloyl-CoA synthase
MDVREQVRVLRAEVPLGPYPERVTDDLERWAGERPDATFLAERRGDGWRTIAFGAMLRRARVVAAGLLARGGSPDAPLAVIAPNGIEHAVVVLAAMYAGIPVSPISTGYAQPGSDPARLRALLDVLMPFAAFVPDPSQAVMVARADAALRLLRDAGALEGDPRDADRAQVAVGTDSIAKILFTSGSTGTPKGVITTHRMLCANQTMLAQIWPAAVAEPVLVDWAPWSHTAAGNKIFGIALRHGGTFYVDEGKPVAGAFAATLRNLREIAPTFYFNVPRGWALLADELERDPALAATFFSRVRVLLNAGASIPEALRRRLAELAARYAGRPVPVVSAWGATETAPMATAVWGEYPAEPETVGTPVPGVEIKLAPVGGLHELRVRAVTVTPGYWRDPAATAAAFDDEGYYKTGDAAELLDAADPSRGIVFGGRIGENFKLASGTWVNVGALRLALLEAANELIDDVLLVGADRDELGALVFPRAAAVADPVFRDRLRAALAEHNARNARSSTRIARALILPAPPDAAAGEITDKGSVNQRRALANRPLEVARLLAEPLDAQVLALD